MSKKSKRKAAARQARRVAASLPGASPLPDAPARKPQQARKPKPAGRSAPARNPRLGILLGGTVLIVLIGAGIVAFNAFTQPSGPLAGTDTARGQDVDGISCNTSEQLVYHIHAHIAVYTNGTPRIISAGIGIVPPVQTTSTSSGPFVYAGTCFYWLHSHTQDGVIHIESPSQHIYTLGNYFDIWGQPLSRSQVGPAMGQVTAYLNGQQFNGDPRSIPLTPHALIQLDVGSASPSPQPFTFAPGL